MRTHLRTQLAATPGYESTEPTTPIPFTISPAPLREPPFDDELPSAATDWVSPMQRPLPFVAEQPPVRHRPALVTHSPRRAAVPEPGAWVRRLLIGVIEAAAHQRPLSQLDSMLTPSVAWGLRQDLAGVGARRHWLSAARISSVRPSEPADGIAELCATLHTPRRAHAVAMRLEIRRGRWVCTRLVLG